MAYTDTDILAYEQAVAARPAERTVSVPGVVAATIWGVGLVLGLVSVAAGHELVAGVSLLVAIMSPWFGLAWASHAQRRSLDALISGGPGAAAAPVPYAGGWPAPILGGR